MNEDLRKLVDDIIEYTKTISITETEWYWNIESVRKPSKVYDKEITWQEFDIARKQEILYDIVFCNFSGIIAQIENDLCCYSENSREYDYIVDICKKIKTYNKDFKVEGVEL